MKQQLLFVQGGGKGAHDDWDAKLVASLQRELEQNYDILYPRMPNEDDPSFARWKPALANVLSTLTDGAVLVGHSVGGTVLVKILTQQLPAAAPAGLFLIAPPFVGAGGWSSDELELPSDLGSRLPPALPIHIFQGLEDEVVPTSHIDLFARAVPQARIHRLTGRDHQLNNNPQEVAAAILALRHDHRQPPP